ncbi:MAG: hypothetical protein ACREUE_08180 [Panacagrimonas sp.]
MGRVIVLLGLGLLVAGCATPAHRPYNSSQTIRRIGLLTPAVSDEVAVRMEVHPGLSLGVVGVLVAASDMSGKSVRFKHAARKEGFDSSDTLLGQLDASLIEAGYEVHSTTVLRPRFQYAFLEQYPPADGTVDAYLDVYADLIGYTAAGGATPYRPTVHLNARLVRAVDHKVLYQDRIAYNAFGDGDGAITLTPAAGYDFAGFEQLVADPVRAVEGLRLALHATGEALARQLQ